MEGHKFNQRGARRIVDAVRASEGPPHKDGPPVDGDGDGGVPTSYYQIFVKITAKAEVDSPSSNKWLYTVTQVFKTALGYPVAGVSGWTLATTVNGVSNGIVDAEARNTCEDMNVIEDASSPTIMGNGIDIDSTTFLATNFAVMPAPVGLVIPAWVVLVNVAGVQTREIWFSYQNAVDGTC